MIGFEGFFLGILSGLITGIVVGIVVGFWIERRRLKNMLKIERIKRLVPHMELVHPVLERISEDVGYLKIMQSRDDDPKDFAQRTCQSFEEYRTWYKVFKENGLKPELEHSSKSLYALINGVFVHAQMVNKYGAQHVLANIEDILEKVDACQRETASFLNQ